MKKLLFILPILIIICSNSKSIDGLLVANFTTGGGIPTDYAASWPIDGNFNDESANGLNGVVTGATLVNGKDGDANSAYYFDGDDYVTVSHDDTLNIGNGNYSYSLWINNTVTAHGVIFEKYTGVDGYLLFNLSTGVLRFFVRGNVIVFGDDDEIVNTGEWVHVVILVNRTTDYVTYYINSVESESFDISSITTSITNTRVLTFGNFNGANDYIGSMDLIRFYKRLLTINEITSLYNE